MDKLKLDSKFTSGSWSGKTVQEVIDTQWFAFDRLFEKNMWRYDQDILSYYRDRKSGMSNRFKKEMKTFVDLKNT